MRKIWDYRCNQCTHTFEKLSREWETIPCPRCGAEAQRLISAPAIQLPGWDTGFPSAAHKWEKQHEKAAEYVPGDDERITHI